MLIISLFLDLGCFHYLKIVRFQALKRCIIDVLKLRRIIIIIIIFFFFFFFFFARNAPRTVHGLSLPLCNLFSFNASFFITLSKLSVLRTFDSLLGMDEGELPTTQCCQNTDYAV